MVGLLNALHTLKRNHVSLQELAEEACHIEINVLGKPIGKHGFVHVDVRSVASPGCIAMWGDWGEEVA